MVKIGLWGSPASGKTTFIAALRHATATSASNDCGTWGIFPVNARSRDLLVDLTQELTQGRFPQATPPGGAKRTQVGLFVGDVTDTRFGRRGWWRRRMPTESRFELDMIDVSGKAFGYDVNGEGGSLEVTRTAIDHLAASDGLIDPFDPLGERDNGDSTNYVNRTSAKAAPPVLGNGRSAHAAARLDLRHEVRPSRGVPGGTAAQPRVVGA